MNNAQIVAVDEPQCRQQVGVGGHHDTDVVSVGDRKPDEINGQGNIDALFPEPGLLAKLAGIGGLA